MEAYQIEHEYGRTVDVYTGPKNIDGNTLTVDFLRIGRLSLIYQTLDREDGAYWSQSQKKWIPLPSRYKRIVSESIDIARKQKAPNFVFAFVNTPKKRDIFIQNDLSTEEEHNKEELEEDIKEQTQGADEE